jgi:predicted amidohydrolase
MNATVRFGVAQIPCTPYIGRNKVNIKTAIDWAAKHDVDYLVTPEASLSGYSTSFSMNFTQIMDALTEIEAYAVSKQVGLCLGTLWLEDSVDGDKKHSVKRNQIRYYSKNGTYLGATNKSVLTPLDLEIGIEANRLLIGVLLPIGNKVIPAAGVICADLYGHSSDNGGLPEQYFRAGVKLLIHSTNAERGKDSFKDELEDLWLESNIRRVSHLLIPMVVADNCYMMDGTEYHGNTATQSGICVKGKWASNAPRTGTQYCYYDFLLDDIAIERFDK